MTTQKRTDLHVPHIQRLVGLPGNGRLAGDNLPRGGHCRRGGGSGQGGEEHSGGRDGEVMGR